MLLLHLTLNFLNFGSLNLHLAFESLLNSLNLLFDVDDTSRVVIVSCNKDHVTKIDPATFHSTFDLTSVVVTLN